MWDSGRGWIGGLCRRSHPRRGPSAKQNYFASTFPSCGTPGPLILDSWILGSVHITPSLCSSRHPSAETVTVMLLQNTDVVTRTRSRELAHAAEADAFFTAVFNFWIASACSRTARWGSPISPSPSLSSLLHRGFRCRNREKGLLKNATFYTHTHK